jgi:radical SAM-linked protein
VQRLRIRYAKRGRLRFTSHRDFARAFERALRRAGIPMAYSAGFSPHPKVSYAGASPTGVASEAEYLEIGLATAVEPDVVREHLDAALPEGLDIVEVVVAEPPSLGDRIDASIWRVEMHGAAAADVAAAVERFLALDEALVERLTKDGRRTVDARSVVVDARVSDLAETDSGDACATMELVVRHVTPTVRPEDVLAALRQAAALSTPVAPVVTRLAQGLLDTSPPAEQSPAEPQVRLLDPLRTSTNASA